MNNKVLIVLVGPTASGKTSLAIKLAQLFQTEIISADSRQFYKEIPIGTAAPTESELQTVPHHFVGHLSIQDNYNVSMFEKDVLKLLEEKFKIKNIMILTGGSGLYIDAVCNGIDDLPDPDIQLRAELNDLHNEKGITALQSKLKELDPVYFEEVDKNNPIRLLRALEVCIQTGKPYSEQRLKKRKIRNFQIFKIGLEVPRDQLNQIINERTDSMIQSGWINEASNLLKYKNNNSLNTVGYKELFRFFEGEWSKELAIEKIKTNTRRYAKRQMTWFKKDDSINWYSPEQIDEIYSSLIKRINS